MEGWPRAAIFDFDGVLVHSEPLHLHALQQVLAPLGVRLREEDYYRDMLGMTDRDTFAALLPSFTDGQLPALLEAKGQLMLQFIAQGRAQLLEGAEGFIRHLNCRRAICSGSRRVEIEAILERAGLRHLFEVIVSADDYPIGKPDPRIYLHTLAMLCPGAAPQECLVVEDSPTVTQRLQAEGFGILGISSSVPPQRLRMAGARWVAANLRDALAEIGLSTGQQG